MAQRGAGYAVVELRDVSYFVDCHHVGTFEGLLRQVGCKGEVRVQTRSPLDARLLISWH